MALKLRPDEQAWLDEFQQALRDNYPGVVEDLVVFDFAVGVVPSGPVPEPQFMVILKGSSDREESLAELTWLGDKLAKPYGIAPRILVYTVEDVKQRRKYNRLPFKGEGKSFWRHNDSADVSVKGGSGTAELPDWARPETWKLRLRPYEREWLAEYRQALRKKYPGLVRELLVFASHDVANHSPRKALNVVVIIKGSTDFRSIEKEIKSLGHQVAGLNPTFPFISVYTAAKWQQECKQDLTFPFYGDGQSVWLDLP